MRSSAQASTLSFPPIDSSWRSTRSLAPPCKGPCSAPTAELHTVYGSASVDATTRAAKVDAFIVWSACRISATSRIRAASSGGRSPVSIHRKLAAVSSSGSGATGSSSLRARWKAATSTGVATRGTMAARTLLVALCVLGYSLPRDRFGNAPPVAGWGSFAGAARNASDLVGLARFRRERERERDEAREQVVDREHKVKISRKALEDSNAELQKALQKAQEQKRALDRQNTELRRLNADKERRVRELERRGRKISNELR